MNNWQFRSASYLLLFDLTSEANLRNDVLSVNQLIIGEGAE